MAKLRYLIQCLTRVPVPARHRCQNCGASRGETVDRKYLITRLKRCGNCGLMYRTPVDYADDNRSFYNGIYRDPLVTDLPGPDIASRMERGQFACPSHDFSDRITLLRSILGSGRHRLFDYGCSWGYGSWQFNRAGFDTVAYEIDQRRARFAQETMGIHTTDDPVDFAARHTGSFDIVFSSHVLEHVPSPTAVAALAWDLLRDGGYLVGFVPNGSSACRASLPNWSQLWGEVHPNFLDDQFLRQTFARSRKVIGGTPLEVAPFEQLQFSEDLTIVRNLHPVELGFIIQKNETRGGW